MDFSPYRKKTVQNTGILKKLLPYIYFLLAGFIGFLIFWIIKSYIITDEGSAIYSTFQKNDVVAETQVSGLGMWTTLLDGGLITQGDKIKVTNGDGGVIILADGSKIYLGQGSEVSIEEIKKDDEGLLFGDIFIEKNPILFSGNTEFNSEKELKIWINKSVYVDAGINTFLVENDIVSVVNGENIHIVKLDTEGKIASQKNIGIGQSLDAQSFSILATPDSAKNHVLLSFFLGEKTSSTPLSEGLPESLTLDTPQITAPLFTGSAIEVKNGKQKISGTASLLAEKIIIVFSNGSITEELPLTTELSEDKTETEWSYTVNITYETVFPGLNTYKIYAVDKNNERSKAAVLVLNYSTDTENNEEDTDETSNDESVSGVFEITSPNGGNNIKLDDNALVLSGLASSNAAFITISIPQTGYSYTLSKFRKGDTTWKYWNNSLKAGEYKFIVYAKDENKKIIGTEKIIITIPASSGEEDSSSQTSTSTPSPVKTEKPTPTPTATPTPAVTISTMEADRN